MGTNPRGNYTASLAFQVVNFATKLVEVFLCLTLLLDLVHSRNNIDTQRPILREQSSLGEGTYFGYTLSLHQTATNASNSSQALSAARIIVSAPNGTAPGASVPNTGLIYSCPVNPGACSPLPGKLFDTTANEADEDKQGQFLGASMASNGERFIVCAHRYARIFQITSNSSAPFPFGKCFISQERALENFLEYQPCTTSLGQLTTFSIGVCQAGASVVIVPDPVGGLDVFGVGAPGIQSWAGALIRRDGAGAVQLQSTETNSEQFAYQGYAVTGGRWLTSQREDFAVSLPRRNRYYGSVNIVVNSMGLTVVSQPLQGTQMGEYYGFSLLAADLNGDGFDELLVGAPLYTANSSEPETGRVYLYRNLGGTLQFVRTIVGQQRYSRFGYAMANLGDISGDGLDDIAISAPFAETGSNEPGSVYIYQSSIQPLLSAVPSQVIRGDDLSLSLDLSGLKGFGTSLASGVDVDLNGYNDLLIGSFISQKVFLLRTRPLVQIVTSISTNPQIIDVFNKSCDINGTIFTCFDVIICTNYTGVGVNQTLDLTVTVFADRQGIDRRLFFSNYSTMTNQSETVAIGVQRCSTFRTFVKNNILDVFNPFTLDVDVATLQRTVTPGNGNEPPEDLSTFPVATMTGPSRIQVEILKDCDTPDCITELRITVNDNIHAPVVAGLTTSVEIDLVIANLMDPAFNAILSFTAPSRLLTLNNAFNKTRNGEVALSCGAELLEDQQTRFNCSIGNPLSKLSLINVTLRLEILGELVGNEGGILINFTVSSLNRELPFNIEDGSNDAMVNLTVEARADVTIDNGTVTPSQVFYGDVSLIPEGTTPEDITQLGHSVDVSFAVRNAGPSRVPTTQLDIQWPLNGPVTGDYYYLYIASITSSGPATVTCENTFINPLGLQDDTMNGVRRKRHSANRRQTGTGDQQPSELLTLNCEDPPAFFLNCVNIRCNIFGLSGRQTVHIVVNARLDERFFVLGSDRYNFVPTAEVSIIDGDFIISDQNSTLPMTSKAHISVIPAARIPMPTAALPTPVKTGTLVDLAPTSVVISKVASQPSNNNMVPTVLPPPPSDSSPGIQIPWVVSGSIVAAFILLAVITVLLWLFGFFRRRSHERVLLRRQELEVQGVGPDPAASTQKATSNL